LYVNVRKKKRISAHDLGIDIGSGREEELFKWFLACLLFGKPIQREIAQRAYMELIKEQIVSPQKVLDAGWDWLVHILDRSHYVRYDFSTATKLLNVCRELLDKYGTITAIIESSRTPEKLRDRLQEFKGIGPKTAEIFLHELKPTWHHFHKS
jgi:endonuclease III